MDVWPFDVEEALAEGVFEVDVLADDFVVDDLVVDGGLPCAELSCDEPGEEACELVAGALVSCHGWAFG